MLEVANRKLRELSEYADDTYGLLLYTLVRIFKPERCLEIGCFLGYSALCIARGLRDNGNGGHLTCVDNESHLQYKGGTQKTRENLAEAELSQFAEVIKSTSKDFFANTLLDEESFDFIHVDGDHTFEGCMFDLRNSWRKLKRKGILVVHDTLFLPFVKKAMIEFISSTPCQYLNFPVFRSCTVLQKGDNTSCAWNVDHNTMKYWHGRF